jgi:hypothetical protein
MTQWLMADIVRDQGKVGGIEQARLDDETGLWERIC